MERGRGTGLCLELFPSKLVAQWTSLDAGDANRKRPEHQNDLGNQPRAQAYLADKTSRVCFPRGSFRVVWRVIQREARALSAFDEDLIPAVNSQIGFAGN